MEVHPENDMGGGTPLAHLTAIRRDMPISLLGVGLSLGSAEGINAAEPRAVLLADAEPDAAKILARQLVLGRLTGFNDWPRGKPLS